MCELEMEELPQVIRMAIGSYVFRKKNGRVGSVFCDVSVKRNFLLTCSN